MSSTSLSRLCNGSTRVHVGLRLVAYTRQTCKPYVRVRDCTFQILLNVHTLQGALEQVTEYLAEVVARPRLCKPRQEIIRLTQEAREKRHHLIRQVHIGLPDLTPPMLPPIRSTFPWIGGDLEDEPSPSSGDHSFDIAQSWQGNRDRLSPSPRSSLFEGSRREPNRPRWNRHWSHEEDPSLRHILAMSRMEYEADQRLNTGETK